jgi:hypothetical protein
MSHVSDVIGFECLKHSSRLSGLVTCMKDEMILAFGFGLTLPQLLAFAHRPLPLAVVLRYSCTRGAVVDAVPVKKVLPAVPHRVLLVLPE